MKQIFLSLIVVAASLLTISALAPSFAFATPQSDICSGVGGTDTSGKCSTSDGISVMGIVKTVIGVLSLVIGVVAVIMVIVSGFKYITSGGDSNGVSSAKNTLIYALVGIAIVALAQFLVHFVLNTVDTTANTTASKSQSVTTSSKGN